MPNPLPPEVLKMIPSERLALADDIYESLDLVPWSDSEDLEDDPEGLTIPPNQRAELERRIKKYEGHPEMWIPGDEVMARLTLVR